jgi:hypothetical protein
VNKSFERTHSSILFTVLSDEELHTDKGTRCEKKGLLLYSTIHIYQVSNMKISNQASQKNLKIWSDILFQVAVNSITHITQNEHILKIIKQRKNVTQV